MQLISPVGQTTLQDGQETTPSHCGDYESTIPASSRRVLLKVSTWASRFSGTQLFPRPGPRGRPSAFPTIAHRTCRRRLLLDQFGHHRWCACDPPTCSCETWTWLRTMHWTALELVADGTLWRGAQLAKDITIFVSLAQGRDRDQGSQPRRRALEIECGRAPRGPGSGTWWALEPRRRNSSQHWRESQEVPLVLQGHAEAAWVRRWSTILACIAARASCRFGQATSLCLSPRDHEGSALCEHGLRSLSARLFTQESSFVEKKRCSSVQVDIWEGNTLPTCLTLFCSVLLFLFFHLFFADWQCFCIFWGGCICGQQNCKQQNGKENQKTEKIKKVKRSKKSRIGDLVWVCWESKVKFGRFEIQKFKNLKI